MMSQATQVVTLRWEEAGEESPQELLDIQPDGRGRLDWAAVEKSFCADVVILAGGASPPVFNQEDASKGLTRKLFQPGSTIFVAVTRKASGGQLDISAKLVEGVGAISTKLDEVLKERTVTRQASKISENELDVVMESLRCKRFWLNADPDLTELLGAPPEEGGLWNDEAAEPTQREMYSSELKQHLPRRANRYAQFELHDARSKAVEIRAAGVHYKLVGKADELIAPRGYHNEPIKGAVMGVEVKKQLAWRTVNQVQAEFLLYASKSSFPFCMVATDFGRGGIAMYYEDDAEGLRVIRGRVFVGMESFWKFFTGQLSSLSPNLGTDAEMVANEVPNPKRRRFSIALEGSPGQQMQTAMQQLAGFYNGLGDVANLDDLRGFPELGPEPEQLIPCKPPYSPELQSQGPHELGRACPSYIT